MPHGVAIALTIWLSGSDRSGGDAHGSFTHVRSTVAYMRTLIRDGYNRSPTFQDLVETLQRTNVIVLVQPGLCAGGRIRSCLVSVAGSVSERHIRIKVDPQHTIRDRLVATIAHELQHAVEIAEHVDVIDSDGVLRLYRRLSMDRCRQGLSEECETERAQATEQKVLKELAAPPFRLPRHFDADKAAAR